MLYWGLPDFVRRLDELTRAEREMEGEVSQFRRRVAEQRESSARELALVMQRVQHSAAPSSKRSSITGDGEEDGVPAGLKRTGSAYSSLRAGGGGAVMMRPGSPHGDRVVPLPVPLPTALQPQYSIPSMPSQASLEGVGAMYVPQRAPEPARVYPFQSQLQAPYTSSHEEHEEPSHITPFMQAAAAAPVQARERPMRVSDNPSLSFSDIPAHRPGSQAALPQVQSQAEQLHFDQRDSAAGSSAGGAAKQVLPYDSSQGVVAHASAASQLPAAGQRSAASSAGGAASAPAQSLTLAPSQGARDAGLSSGGGGLSAQSNSGSATAPATFMPALTSLPSLATPAAPPPAPAPAIPGIPGLVIVSDLSAAASARTSGTGAATPATADGDDAASKAAVPAPAGLVVSSGPPRTFVQQSSVDAVRSAQAAKLRLLQEQQEARLAAQREEEERWVQGGDLHVPAWFQSR